MPDSKRLQLARRHEVLRRDKERLKADGAALRAAWRGTNQAIKLVKSSSVSAQDQNLSRADAWYQTAKPCPTHKHLKPLKEIAMKPRD